jgi:hypothetical protein
MCIRFKIGNPKCWVSILHFLKNSKSIYSTDWARAVGLNSNDIKKSVAFVNILFYGLKTQHKESKPKPLFQAFLFSRQCMKAGWSDIYVCLQIFVMSARKKEFSIHLI